MKKVLTALAIVLVSGLYAEEAGRKIGFGVGIGGAGIFTPDYVGMKWAVTPTITLEPTIHFDKTTGETETPHDTTKFDDMEIGVGVKALFPFMSGGNTDLFGFGGLSFAMLTEKEEWGHGDEYKTTGTTIGIPFGIGLEHFITKAFSVDLRANSGFSIISSKTEYTPDGEDTETTREFSGMSINLNNVIFRAAFYWYLL